MTDKIFISNYLDKYFRVKLDSSGYVFVQTENGRAMGNTEFSDYIRKVLTNYKTDDGRRSIDICNEWFVSRKSKATNVIDEYLSDCRFTLGRREWIITKPDGKVITIRTLWEHFEGQFTQQFLTHYFGDWFSIKVCEESERLMNNF